MRSHFLCLPMIRHYVTAVMICSFTVKSSLSGRCSPAPPVGRQMKRVTHQGFVCVRACMCVCTCVCYTTRGSMVIRWRKRGYWNILHWKVSLPSCACICVWASVCGHEAVGMLRWQMALLHCRATLANRGRTGRRWERRRRWDASQREGRVRMLVQKWKLWGGSSLSSGGKLWRRRYGWWGDEWTRKMSTGQGGSSLPENHHLSISSSQTI